MKTFSLSIFLILTTFLFGQEPEVILSIDPVSADVGELFTISVKSNVQGKIEIDNLPSSFVQGYQVTSGMVPEMDVNTGKVITYYFFSQTGAIGVKGSYTIGPVFVKRGNKTYRSNTVKIKIGEKTVVTNLAVTNEQLKEPAFGIIQINKSTIYEGEPIIISARIYSHFEPTHLEGYRSYSVPGTIDRSKLGSSKRIVVEEEVYKNYKLFSFEYDRNILFPDITGTFKIESYSMKLNQNFKGYQFKSNHAVVEVIPLPENPPQEFIGAVGHFTIERSIEDTVLKQGDVFKMLISIIGSGNLHNILEPTPKLPKGYIIYGDPEIEEDYVFNSKGTEGKIHYKYNIQVNKSGRTVLPPTTVAFFDPQKEEYISIASGATEIKVEADKNYITTTEQTSPENLEVDPQDYLRKSKTNKQNNSFFGSGPFWMGITVPLFSAFFFLFLLRRKEETADKTIIKTISKNKRKQLSLLLAQVGEERSLDNDNSFFSKIETALKMALELYLGTDPNESLSKQALTEKLVTNHDSYLSNVKSIFSKCDQFRYGFGASEDSKNEILKELNYLVNKLK